MCTIVVLHRVHPAYPVVVAANRDEFYGRAAGPPRLLADEPRVVGGVDLERAGTWLGVTATGLLVALTNQRTATVEPGRPSRGLLVLDALRAGSTAGVEALLGRTDPAAFNPCNLLYGDADGLRVAYLRPDPPELRIEAVPDGVRVLGNDVLDSGAFPKVARARALGEAAAGLPGPALLPALAALLGDHALPDDPGPPHPRLDVETSRRLQALCVHTPAYGTRSASIVALGPGRVERYLAAGGPPCTAGFEDVTALVSPP